MTANTRKKIFIWGGAALVGAFLIYGFLPDATTVQTVQVERGPMQVTVQEEGVTRVVDRFTVSAPAAAWVRRIDLEAGDEVEAGQALVHLEPPRSALLDPRSRAQAEAGVEAAEAGLLRAQRAAEAARAAANQAEAELERITRLAELGSATAQMRERAETEAVTARANLDAAEAAVTAARAELRSVQASLNVESGTGLEAQTTIRAPADGRVLTVYQQSAGMVAPGTPLLDIGNTSALEVRVDVLSQDAVLINPGTRVVFEQWGGEGELEGTVKRVEPQGFTSVSSLGVEEQRVNVIAGIDEAPPSLGSGFRVLARFIVWEEANVLQIPLNAVFRTDTGWAVFVVEGGRAFRCDIQIGKRTGLSAQIISGLQEGTQVITHPDNNLEDGARVE